VQEEPKEEKVAEETTIEEPKRNAI
jgi:hypothetical protein